MTYEEDHFQAEVSKNRGNKEAILEIIKVYNQMMLQKMSLSVTCYKLKG